MLATAVGTSSDIARVCINGVHSRLAFAASFWARSSRASFSSAFSTFPVAVDSSEESFVVVWIDEALLGPSARALLRATFVDMVDRREPLVPHQELSACVDHKVSELLVAQVVVRHTNCEMVPQLVGQNGVEVRLELILGRATTTGFDEVIDLILVLGHAHSHRLKSLDRIGTNHPDLVSQLFESYGSSIVQEPDDAPPCIDSLAHFGLLEHHLRLSRRAVREEAPHSTVE